MKKIFWIGLALLAAAYASHMLRPPLGPKPWDTANPPQTELKVLQRAFYYIKNNYIAPDRLAPAEVLRNGLTALQKGLAPVMVTWNPDHFIIEVADQKRRFNLPRNLSFGDFPTLLGHVADFIQTQDPTLLDPATDEKNLEYLLLSGTISALDAHSNFLIPQIYSEFKIGTKGNFGGIGIAIGIRDGHLTVIAPLEGTPADRAGLKSKDRIVQIGDERTINMSLTEAVERLRGKIGTKVSLMIEREGLDTPLSFTIRRALIKIDSVKAERLTDKVLLVKIKNFQEDTTSEMYRQLRELSHDLDELNGIVLDMRNNPGGLLNQAVAVADAFLAGGIIVSTVGFNDQLDEKDYARKNNPYEDVPLIVLVNEGSASASEIVAGALQLHNRAFVIGNQTFGKGTVQTIYDLKDGSAIKLTIAKYLAAGTEDVQAFGIVPDVTLVPVRIGEKRIDLVEDEKTREQDLDKPLIEGGDTAEVREPAFKLKYLGTEEEEENITGTVKLEHDYPVELARQILTQRSAFSREAWLQEIKPLMEQAAAAQEERVVEKLATREIDWSLGKATGKPSAQVRFWITHEEKTVAKIEGGQEIKLHVEVQNTGDAPFYRLLAISRSDNPFLNELEFPLGKIEAGNAKSYAVPVTVPAAIVSRQEPLSLRFQEAFGRHPAKQNYPILSQAPPLPRFAYRWHFGKDYSSLIAGEDIPLIIEVENIGTGTSEKPVVNLVNLEGDQVYLTQGRARLDPIPPGKTGQAKLIVRLQKEYKANTARFNLSIEDHHTADFLRDKLTLAVGSDTHNPPANTLQRPPTIELSLPESPYWSQENEYTFEGIVRDNEEVKQVYVFVKADKVFYQASSPSTPTTLPLTVTVSLQPGENRITVFAEDNSELLSRESWVVWKPENL